MCIPLVARVLAVEGQLAEIELVEGEVVRANIALHPDVNAGQYVLVDRGLILEMIEPDQVEDILSFYTELNQLWEEQEAVSG